MIIPITPGSVPAGFCPQSYQDIINMFASLMTVNITNSNLSIYVSATKPPVALQGQVVWQRLDTIGRPIGLYWFAQGAWLAPHPILPGHTNIYFGTLPSFSIYDGGDANALSDISGPMWEVAAELNAKFPVGPGTLPSTKVLAAGDTGGEENHKITLEEMFPHAHAPSDDTSVTFIIAGNPYHGPTVGGAASNGATTSVTAKTGGDKTNTPPTDSKGHNTMPPYECVYFLRRTARLFYAVS